jgi:adenylosuccinate synthase
LKYLNFLADLMEVPISIVSLGPSRDQTIIVEDPIHGPKRGLLSSDGTPVDSGWLK